MILLVIELLIELQKSQKFRHNIIQKQLQINMIKKPKKRYISLKERQNYG